MDTGISASTDSQNQDIVEVVVNRRVLQGKSPYGENSTVTFSMEIAKRKGLKDVNLFELDPEDSDLIAVLKSHPYHAWPSANGADVRIENVPSNSRYILKYIECADNYYDEEHLIVLDDSDY
ncbi:MAG: hypothetical protein WCO55_01355 [Candidatus Falkowbacteria bacterium]